MGGLFSRMFTVRPYLVTGYWYSLVVQLNSRYDCLIVAQYESIVSLDQLPWKLPCTQKACLLMVWMQTPSRGLCSHTDKQDVCFYFFRFIQSSSFFFFTVIIHRLSLFLFYLFYYGYVVTSVSVLCRFIGRADLTWLLTISVKSCEWTLWTCIHKPTRPEHVDAIYKKNC